MDGELHRREWGDDVRASTILDFWDLTAARYDVAASSLSTSPDVTTQIRQTISSNICMSCCICKMGQKPAL
jgi:hypothetical protein